MQINAQCPPCLRGDVEVGAILLGPKEKPSVRLLMRTDGNANAAGAARVRIAIAHQNAALLQRLNELAILGSDANQNKVSVTGPVVQPFFPEELLHAQAAFDDLAQDGFGDVSLIAQRTGSAASAAAFTL